MIFKGANPLLGPLEEAGPENLFDTNDTRFSCCHSRAQKVLIFRAQRSSKGFPPSKSFRPGPFKQQGTVKWGNIVFGFNIVTSL
jgi:hypothetical protein